MSERFKVYLMVTIPGAVFVEALTLLFMHLGWYG